MAVKIFQFSHGVQQDTPPSNGNIVASLLPGANDTDFIALPYNAVPPSKWSEATSRKIVNALRSPSVGNVIGRMRINPRILAGFTYLGQFISHDISMNRIVTKQKIANLQLQSLYGGGPSIRSDLYTRYPKHFEKDKLISNNFPAEIDQTKLFYNIKMRHQTLPDGRTDLLRDSFGLAKIADSRNDQNVLLSQLHCKFIQIHNAMAEAIALYNHKDGYKLDFDVVNQAVICHYQWIVLHQYLKLLVHDPALVDELIASDQNFILFQPNNPARLTDTFSRGAFRIGHSQVLDLYTIKSGEPPRFIFNRNANDLRGFKALGAVDVNWNRFFFEGKGEGNEFSAALDHSLAPPLFDLEFLDKGRRSLAMLNIISSQKMNFGHGMASALMNHPGSVKKPNNRLITHDEILNALGFTTTAGKQLKDALQPDNLPLWLYLLLEAEILENGQRLGPLGSQIIAEQIVWAIRCSPVSILKSHNTFVPLNLFNNEYFKGAEDQIKDFEVEKYGKKYKFGIQHLLMFPDFVKDKLKDNLTNNGLEGTHKEAVNPSQPKFALMPTNRLYVGTEPMNYEQPEFDAHRSMFSNTANERVNTLSQSMYNGTSTNVKSQIHVFFSTKAIRDLLGIPDTTNLNMRDSRIKGLVMTYALDTTDIVGDKLNLLVYSADEKGKSVNDVGTGNTKVHKAPNNNDTLDNESNVHAALVNAFTNLDAALGVVRGYKELIGNQTTPTVPQPKNVLVNNKAMFKLLFSDAVPNIAPTHTTFQNIIKSDLDGKFVTLGAERAASGGNAALYREGEPCPPKCYVPTLTT